MKIQKRLSRYGTAGILLADMSSVYALVKVWSGWNVASPEDVRAFRWATALLFLISIVIVPIVFFYCNRIDVILETKVSPPNKVRTSRRKRKSK